jgi:hypothetical protein
MEVDNIMLSFKGLVTSDLLTSVLSIMESKMEHLDESPKVRKKVFNVLVECLQNLYHHSEKDKMQFDELESDTAIFTISKINEQYVIQTGNYIKNSQVAVLKDKLDLINSMNPEELKAFYQQALKNGERSEKGTAGLGMIDIARKSGNKLEYSFLDVDKSANFFSLTIKVA